MYLNKKYIYILFQRHATSSTTVERPIFSSSFFMIRTLSINSIYFSVFQYIFIVFNFIFSQIDLYGAIGLCLCISLLLIGLNNTFLLHHYFSQIMLFVTTPLSGWLVHLNRHHSMSNVALMVDPHHVL